MKNIWFRHQTLIIRTRTNQKNSIVHEPFQKTSLENLSMDLSKSECNIINEIDVPTNVITELNYDEHIEPSVSVKGAVYFNIFECGRNLLDQVDVTYQRAFKAPETSSSVTTGYCELSPARERYYDMQANHIKEKNVGMDKYEIHEAISCVKLEYEEEHERNIEYIWLRMMMIISRPGKLETQQV